MDLLFLGTGTSHGIPVVACDCAVCRSDDPRDIRWRSSILIKGAGGERILVDAGPEFRLQAVRSRLRRLDAVLLTHAHADHVHGIDDLRPLTHERPMPVFGNISTISEIKERFSYAFRETQIGGGKPRIEPSITEQDFSIGALKIQPIPAKHGDIDILGWRIDEESRSIAYLTDVSFIPPESLARLRGLDTLVLGALRVRPHATHLNFDQALDLSQKLAPKKAIFTHICHEHSHREIEKYCEKSKKTPAFPAYDELRIAIC